MFTRSTFRYSGVWILLLLCHFNTWAQQPTQTTCQAKIDSYVIPVFGEFSSIKGKMPLEEDVDITTADKWGYFYTADIRETANYVINPEVAFEGSNKDAQTITKQSFNYIIEIPRKDTKDAQKILGEVFKVIGGQLPFLSNIAMNAGEHKRVPCTCGTCDITVSRLRAGSGAVSEIEINIRLTPQASTVSKK